MIIGYARVSTGDQRLDSQIDALSAAGSKKIFADKIGGSKRVRPELNKMLDQLRDGDVVIVTKYRSQPSFTICSKIRPISQLRTHYKRQNMTHPQEGGTGGEVSEILFFSAKSKRRPSLIYFMQIIPVCLSIVAR